MAPKRIISDDCIFTSALDSGCTHGEPSNEKGPQQTRWISRSRLADLASADSTMRRPRIPIVELERLIATVADGRPTPQSTIEAVMYCVRERGLAALREPANQQRLATFDDAARAEVNMRIAKLEKAGPLSHKDSENAS
jgi:hypothetical protein